VNLGGVCGAYYDPTNFPPSNGYNTYVSNQSVAPQPGTTQVLTANSATSWSLFANNLPLGYTGVQTYPDTQQLFNNWNGSGWGSGSSATPLSSLTALTVTYDETSPGSGNGNNGYQFSPDVWTSYAGHLGPGSGDIMFWVDTSPLRCTDNGLSSSNILGQVTIDSQNWTVYRYGPWGGEIVFILNAASNNDPVGNGTCAQQSSGTINIKAGLEWLIDNGAVSAPLSLTQLNNGWEITSVNNGTFTLNSLSINTTLGSGGPSSYAPYPSTGTPRGISASSITIAGTVLPQGQSSTYRFHYGRTTSYGISTPSFSAGSGNVPVDVSVYLTGLRPSTTYHYRVEATNATGTGYGEDRTFRTPCDCTTYSVWNSSVTPGNTSADDSSSVELGTRFTPSESGQINAIRFYKGPGNTGPHTGSLWTASGALLGRVAFTKESISGWQTAGFPTPIAVTEGQTYVVSYHAPKGRYAYDHNALVGDITNGPLTAPADAVGAPNGVFDCCGDAVKFPAQTFKSSAYYVDVVFEPLAPTDRAIIGSTVDSTGAAEAQTPWSG
jgi:hypothetical protein